MAPGTSSNVSVTNGASAGGAYVPTATRFTTSHRLSTPSYAFASASLDIGPDTPTGIGDFAKIRIQAASGQPVFVGIGPRDDVARYLERVDHSVITDFDTDPWIVTAHRR